MVRDKGIILRPVPTKRSGPAPESGQGPSLVVRGLLVSGGGVESLGGAVYQEAKTLCLGPLCLDSVGSAVRWCREARKEQMQGS